MKKVSPILKRALLILVSVLLLLLTIWLGYSFFSMKSDTPHLQTVIDLRDDILAQKVVSDFSEKMPSIDFEALIQSDGPFPEKEVKLLLEEGNYIFYKYAITIYEISSEEEEYVIGANAERYFDFFDSWESSKFKYSLPKDKGSFDFSQLEYQQPIELILKYRVDDDLKYFMEYSTCTLKDFIGIESSYGDSKCVIQRDFVNWEIKIY